MPPQKPRRAIRRRIIRRRIPNKPIFDSSGAIIGWYGDGGIASYLRGRI
jgi:hypothetical protein